MLALYLNMLDTDEERTCFSGIYEKYKRLVYYSAWQVLHDDGLAEDILQEVFLYVARNYSKLPVENRHKLARYLVISGRTRAVNLLEKQSREIPTEEPIEEEFPSEDIPEDAVISRTRVEELMHLVDDLDEKYRLPLELLARGASYEESASLLGIPEPTLRKRIERGRKYLWEKVNENDGNKDGLV